MLGLFEILYEENADDSKIEQSEKDKALDKIIEYIFQEHEHHDDDAECLDNRFP